MPDICAHIKAFIFIKLACNVLTTLLTCDFIFSSSPPPPRRIKLKNIQGGRAFFNSQGKCSSTEKYVFLRRSCLFLRRRGAPFGPPHRASHKCYAFPPLSYTITGGPARYQKVSPKTWRISAFADARMTPSGSFCSCNYHWTRLNFEPATISTPLIFAKIFCCFCSRSFGFLT
jgi:hypothetical protein